MQRYNMSLSLYFKGTVHPPPRIFWLGVVNGDPALVLIIFYLNNMHAQVTNMSLSRYFKGTGTVQYIG
jgi:hypothetical protein